MGQLLIFSAVKCGWILEKRMSYTECGFSTLTKMGGEGFGLLQFYSA